MARLSTHVLDTEPRPARGRHPYRTLPHRRKTGAISCAPQLTNATAAPTEPLLSADSLPGGIYELVFHAATTSAASAHRSPIRPFWTRSSSASASMRPPDLPRAAAALAVRLQHLPGIVMRRPRHVELLPRARRAEREPGRTLRTFLSPPMREVHDGSQWMEAAGMTCARRCSRQPARRLSRRHGAGAAPADRLAPRHRARRRRVRRHPRRRAGHRAGGRLGGRRLPFAIEVVGFSEEEGVRFGVPFIGSRALAGTLDADLLARRDAAGITVARPSAPSASTPRNSPRPRWTRVRSATSNSTSSRGRCSNARAAARRSHRDRRPEPPGRHLSRPGQPRRHDADAPAPRCAGRCGALDLRGRTRTPATTPGWSRRWARMEVRLRRGQRHSRRGARQPRRSPLRRRASARVGRCAAALRPTASASAAESAVDWRQHADQSAAACDPVPDRLAVARRDSRGFPVHRMPAAPDTTR